MDYKIPESLKYTDKHEWIEILDKHIVLGITDFAQSALGDIVYLELPKVGTSTSKNKPFGIVESIKSVSDLFCPVEGEVVEVNSKLTDNPEAINTDPYKNWLIKVKLKSDARLEHLLSSSSYRELCHKE